MNKVMEALEEFYTSYLTDDFENHRTSNNENYNIIKQFIQRQEKRDNVVNQMIEESKIILANIRKDFGSYDTATTYASIELAMLKEVKRKLEEVNEVE